MAAGRGWEPKPKRGEGWRRRPALCRRPAGVHDGECGRSVEEHVQVERLTRGGVALVADPDVRADYEGEACR